MKPIARKGRARPSPSPPKTGSAAHTGSTSVAPSAAPSSGPLHGVATKAARAPVKNPPTAPPSLASFFAPPKDGRSTVPSRYIGRAHVCTHVTHRQPVFRIMVYKHKQY